MSPNPSTCPALFDELHDPLYPADDAQHRALTQAWRIPEPQAVQALLGAARLPAEQAGRTRELAMRLAQSLRNRQADAGKAGLVQSLLQEYSLSSQEGVALMCLAEALLRIPDAATRDALIRDKIAQGQWRDHLGKSPSLFVNAATWGLLLTGKLVSTHSETGLGAALGRLVSVGGEPLIRKGVDMAMRMMGEQFVTGETIQEALSRARKREAEGFRYSFDMLGEAALTADDAARYLQQYEAAIHAIGQASAGRGVYEGPGISIKLSALHPRYSRAQWKRVSAELYPVLRRLCVLARQYDMGLNIDAEEADRLEISLALLDRLAFDPALAGWQGLGFVVQAYQKRCPWVIDRVIDLARRSDRRLMVRLVKGAYWDSEIKRAQIDGLDGYPVFTRKPYTDVSYLACARKLLAAPDAVYAQFATHNAHTLAAIHQMADPQRYTPQQYEFQCLHGMGEPLYEQVVGDAAQGGLGRPCRIYAPVGSHETLLAYLVRRLLENGANTSFVHRMADLTVPLADLVEDPVAVVDAWAQQEGAVGLPHPAIVLPRDLYGPGRANSCGLDLASDLALQPLADACRATLDSLWKAGPMLAVDTDDRSGQPVHNPAHHADVVGTVTEATEAEVALALDEAVRAASAWGELAPAQRARCLMAAADRLEADMLRLMGLLIREAGKTASNAVAEVREAVDFLRYYSRQAEGFDPATHRPLGPVVCISPWNFPLAIFIGQVAASLAAGNVVLAKPAEQTPLIAAEAVRLLWAAGVPRAAVQLLPGAGPVVGAALVGDARVQGVLFTGSTEVARLLQRGLVGRTGAQGQAVPLIAETGGQNAMIVDSSALTEQVVTDVLASAFDSAGQRCSALRVLCVQEEAAERTLAMLLGAMAQLKVGRPDDLSVDVGPVIDDEARQTIEAHIQRMAARGCRVHRVAALSPADAAAGTYVMPTVIEIDGLGDPGREVFGPVLHLVRYRRDQLDTLLDDIHATGYGLTMGLHTRIDETIARVASRSAAGNLYVNRNMVGAVVGVQPFGGEGLSGTGPKAGGPLYLYRLLSQRPADVLGRVLGSDTSQALPGPTGERNVYRVQGRHGVLCLASSAADLRVQLDAVRAAGGQALVPPESAVLCRGLPGWPLAHVTVAADHWASDEEVEIALLHGSLDELAEVQAHFAARPGPVVAVERLAPGTATVALERLVVERALSVNTAAAGGNATLMTLA